MGLLIGFTTILVVIAIGSALAHTGVLDDRSQRTLGEIAFFVATPALMLVTISRVEVSGAAANLAASAGSLAFCFGAYALIARLRWKVDTGALVIGSLSASYVNAGNLGLAIAAYVVGDITVVVPTLLVQMLCVQPACLIVLDRVTGRRHRRARGAAAADHEPVDRRRACWALVLAVTGWSLPEVVWSPIELLASAAIPLMLLSYGAALRLSPRIGRAGTNREVLTVAVLKLAVMPVVAWLLGVALDLHETVLLGVVITAALPTAQNIFLHATRYRTGEDVARESILVTTLCSLPIALVIALLLG